MTYKKLHSFKKPVKDDPNPIVRLANICHARFGQSITSKVIEKNGPDHIPTITVIITIPNAKEFTGIGSNQKLARQDAATKALEYLKRISK